MIKLLSYPQNFLQERIFKKGEMVQIEGHDSEQLYILLTGKVSIYKILEYLNENDEKIKKQQMIMDIFPGDVIGEDRLWYERNNHYSVKVTHD